MIGQRNGSGLLLSLEATSHSLSRLVSVLVGRLPTDLEPRRRAHPWWSSNGTGSLTSSRVLQHRAILLSDAAGGFVEASIVGSADVLTIHCPGVVFPCFIKDTRNRIANKKEARTSATAALEKVASHQSRCSERTMLRQANLTLPSSTPMSQHGPTLCEGPRRCRMPLKTF